MYEAMPDYFCTTAADCSPAPAIGNGSLLELPGGGLRNPVYTAVTYMCDKGFKLVNTNNADNGTTLVCGEDSQWKGEVPTCQSE